MAYVPLNVDNYQAAFIGAFTGMGFGGRISTVIDPLVYAGALATNADAVAQAVDQSIGASQLSPFGLNLLTQIVQSEFEGRFQNKNAKQADFTTIGLAITEAIEGALFFFAGQGIPTINTSTSIVKQIQSNTVAAPGFGTINQGDAAKVTNTVNITVQDGNSRLRIIGQLSGNGGVHDGRVTVSLDIGGVPIQTALESWVAADDVSRSICIVADLDPPGAGAHVITMTIQITTGAAGTTFADSGTNDVLIVEEYQNQS